MTNAFSADPEQGAPRRRRHRRRKSNLSRALASNGERIVAGLLIAVVVGSAQLLGAVHVPVLLGVAILGVSACVLCYRARLVPDWRVPRPALILIGLAAFSALQALPLPMGLLATIAPNNAEVWRGALTPFGEPGPSWAALSLDPGASLVEATKWLLYAAVFATAAALGSRRGAQWGARIVFVSGALVAVSSLIHRLVGATAVYGVYEPVGEFAREKIGPLLNPNNLSGYLNVAAFAGFGLLVMRRPPMPRWLIGLGVALELGALIEASSRGGLAAFGLGVLALGPALVIARKRSDPTLADQTTVRWVVIGVLVGGAALALLALAQHGPSVIDDKNVEKIKLLSWARPMLAEHPIFGIGRGAFESVFPEYRTGQANVIYTHPENFVAQWLCEWGLPVGGIGLVLLGFSLRPRELGFGRDAVAVGVVVALLALLAQNLVDLGLEVPAIPLAAVTALGACWGGSRAHLARRVERDADTWPVTSAWVLAAASVLTVGAAGYYGWRTVGSDRLRLNEDLGEADLKNAETRAWYRKELRAAMLRHPAEPYFARIGAFIAWRGGDQNPLPWIDRSLERGLSSGRTHYLLARILASQGRASQALLEARFAAEYDPELSERIAELALKISQQPSALLGIVPLRRNPAPVLKALIRHLGRDEYAGFRQELLALAIERFPQQSAPRFALAQDLLDALTGAKQAERCGGDKREDCIAKLSREIEVLRRMVPDDPEAVELQAQLLLATGRADEAEQLLATTCQRFPNNRRCKKLRITAAARAKSEATFAEATRDILADGCETPSACADSYETLADTLASSGNWEQARAYYARAAKEDGSAERWLKVAKAASKAGAHLEAADALGRVIRERGPDPKLQEQMDAERKRGLLRQLTVPK
jgi:tetratricopeptide (TPR) repeat protein